MLGLGNTTTGTEVELDTTGQNNSRAIHIFGGNLFYSTQKGTDGIHYYSGLPTSDSPADHLLIATGNTDSLNDFDISPGAIQSAGSYVYLVDSRVSSGNGGGGVQRWNWNGSAYQLAYTFTMPGSDQGMEGLAVDFSTNTIFATTPTHVYEVTDTGVAPPGLAETMTSIDTITDTVHYAFRGIALAPTAVPEPGSIVLLVTGLLGLLCYAWRRRK